MDIIDDNAGVITMLKWSWPELLVTLLACPAVRIITGSGIAAPLTVVAFPAVRNIAAAAPPTTIVAAAAAAAQKGWEWETSDAA